MDTQKINDLLHSDFVPDHYTAKVGDSISISLPRIPFTRFTEFLQVEQERQGDLECFIEERVTEQGEGSLLPREISGRTVCPGELHIVLSAKDSLSGERIADVEPLDIVVEVQE